MLQGNPIAKKRLAKVERQSGLYFTAGELVRILGVGEYMSFHYDEIGLPSPTLREENGYRYHFVWQMGIFEVIRALQKLGMSLEKIEEYMEDCLPERFMSMMGGKKRQIDEEIRCLKNTKRFALHEEESVQLAMRTTLDGPRLVERDREYPLVSDISMGPERKVAVEIVEHVRMQEKYHGTVDAVGLIYLGEDMDRGTHDRYMKVYIRLDKETVSRRAQNRSKGVYVGLYNRGHLWDMEKPYRLISTFVREQGTRLGQMWYEGLIPGELTVKEHEQYIVKVMVLVESKVINP